MKRSHIVFLVLFLVLLIDQALKIYIKTNFYYGESYRIFGLDWAQLHFIENNGMAFGIEFGDKCIGNTKADGSCGGLFISAKAGKILLSLLRVVMVGFLFYLLKDLIKNKEPKGLIVGFTLILAGAIGNIIDSIFYGVMFSNSPYHTNVTAELFPATGGYEDFFFGRVVDMFYFPMFHYTWPEWVPRVGGDSSVFFSPVFNVADSAITIGVFVIIVFYHKFLLKPTEKNAEIESSEEIDLSSIS